MNHLTHELCEFWNVELGMEFRSRMHCRRSHPPAPTDFTYDHVLFVRHVNRW